MARLALGVMLAGVLASCGQKGPLQRPAAPAPLTSSITLNAAEAASWLQA